MSTFDGRKKTITGVEKVLQRQCGNFILNLDRIKIQMCQQQGRSKKSISIPVKNV